MSPEARAARAERVVTLYRSGAMMKDIIKRERLSPPTARAIIRASGIELRAQPVGGWPKAEEARLKTLICEEGKTLRQAAAALGRTKNMIVAKCWRLGLVAQDSPKRPKPSPPAARRLPQAPPVQKVKAEAGPRPKPAAKVIEFEPVANTPTHQIGGNNQVREVKPAVPVRKITGATPESRLLPFIHPSFGGCRWPVSGQGADTLFCCAPRPEGWTYCRGHYPNSVARPLTDAEMREWSDETLERVARELRQVQYVRQCQRGAERADALLAEGQG